MNYAVAPSMIYQLVNTDACLIDLRDSHQFSELHLKNFTNITEDHLSFYLPTLPKDKPIYLICYSGRRAQKLAMQLRQLEYVAYYIEGGFQAFLNISNNQYF